MLCRRGTASGAFAPAGLVRQGRGRLILEIDVGKLLAVVVAHDKAGVQLLDGPRRREAALRQAVMTLGTIAKIRNITSTLRVRGDLIGDRPMAANHIFGLGNPVPTATATLVAAILVISAMPVQGQQPSADQLKAHAQNAVKIISGDKQKTEAYCELTDLTDQFEGRGIAEETGFRI